MEFLHLSEKFREDASGMSDEHLAFILETVREQYLLFKPGLEDENISDELKEYILEMKARVKVLEAEVTSRQKR